MVGPPGAGKTMMARRVATILPPLTFEEALEATSIHSVAGLLPTGTRLLSRTAVPGAASHHLGRGARRRRPASASRRDQPRAPRRALPRRDARVQPARARSASPAGRRGLGAHREGGAHGGLPRAVHADRRDEPVSVRIPRRPGARLPVFAAAGRALRVAPVGTATRSARSRPCAVAAVPPRELQDARPGESSEAIRDPGRRRAQPSTGARRAVERPAPGPGAAGAFGSRSRGESVADARAHPVLAERPRLRPCAPRLANHRRSGRYASQSIRRTWPKLCNIVATKAIFLSLPRHAGRVVKFPGSTKLKFGPRRGEGGRGELWRPDGIPLSSPTEQAGSSVGSPSRWDRPLRPS